MQRALVLSLLVVVGSISVLANPIPYVHQPLVPAAKTPGSAGFTLTVNGAGFVQGAVVKWNGSPRTTTYVSAARVTATIPAGDIAAIGTANVTVVNPGTGSVASNVAYFQVANPVKVVSLGPYSQAIGTLSAGVAVGDFNGDGLPDVITNDGRHVQEGKDLIAWLESSNGLLNPVYTGTHFAADPFIAADFNGDGRLDVLMLHSGWYQVFLGQGDGTFQGNLFSGPFFQTSGIAVGDFNGDGKLDFAAIDSGTYISLGNGDGTFQSPQFYANGLNGSLVIGDFNGDGVLDLAALSSGPAPVKNYVSVTLGNGDGTFGAPRTFPVLQDSVGLATSDFNSDGKLDLVVGYHTIGRNVPSAISLLMGNGDGTFRLHKEFPLNADTGALSVGDFNGDGKLDIFESGTSAFSSLLLGNGNGGFQAAVDSDYGGPLSGVGDFNRDGLMDIVFANGLVTALALAQPAPVAKLSKASLVFPLQVVGTTSSPQVVTLTNTGSAPLAVPNVSILGDFVETSNCPASLPPSSKCMIKMTFQPTTIDARPGIVNIQTDNGNILWAFKQITLSGTGTVVSYSANRLAFAPQKVGTTSLPQTVTLTNTSLNAVGINGISITGANNGDFKQTNTCGVVVQARSACKIRVTFKPTAIGARAAAVTVNDTGGGSPQTMTLTGTGQ